MDNHVYSFEKLRVWQKSRKLVSRIYFLSQQFPHEEKFGITNQIRRAAISVPANIAEGVSRVSHKDQANFSQMSYSSLMELLSHLYIANDLGYLKPEKLKELRLEIFEISKLLASLRNAQISKHGY